MNASLADDRSLDAALAERATQRRHYLYQRHEGETPNPYSQKAVAARIGVSNICLCHWETQVNYPGSLDRWQRWFAAVELGLKIEVEEP